MNDKFFAIIYPFRSMLWLKRHKVITIYGIWLFGALIASPQLFYSRIESFNYRGQQYDDCREQFSYNVGLLYTIFLFLFTFFLPIIALIFVYSRICLHLINNTTVPGNPDQNRDKYCVNKKIKVIKMLVTIVVLFAMCWFPIHLFQLLVWFYPSIQKQKTTFSYYVYVGSYFLCHWLAMAHSFVNPFVYCFMSGNFRQSLGKTLSHCWPRLFNMNNQNYTTSTTLEPNPQINNNNNNDNHQQQQRLHFNHHNNNDNHNQYHYNQQHKHSNHHHHNHTNDDDDDEISLNTQQTTHHSITTLLMTTTTTTPSQQQHSTVNLSQFIVDHHSNNNNNNNNNNHDSTTTTATSAAAIAAKKLALHYPHHYQSSPIQDLSKDDFV